MAAALLLFPALAVTSAHAITQDASTQKPVAKVGSIKSISGNTLTITTDDGVEWEVQYPTEVAVLRLPPGSKDLKEATAMSLSGLQAGDRILVRGIPGSEANSVVANRIVAMKKEDIAQKNAKETEDWQRHGIGGLVKSVDGAKGTIIVGTRTVAGPKDVVIHTTSTTALLRYATGSAKFETAKAAPITDIHEGDQVSARGTRSADGSEFAADEVVSGSFRNIAGTVVAVDTAAGKVTISDLAAKKNVELKLTDDSRVRKLPAPMAQAIAARLKNAGADAPGGNAPPTGTGQTATQPGATAAAGQGQGAGANARPGASGGGDFQQILRRLPASTLNDFQKGDAVMIVAAANSADNQATIITLLGGVEPILQGPSQGQAASILSSWSLNPGGGADTSTP